jgi:pimeloyl-ACP methyl ester carboxylesterase
MASIVSEHIEFASGALSIAADHVRADGDVVVVMANDLRTHKRWIDRYPTIAQKLGALGIASIAFDYAGCGESADVTITINTLTADLHAAVAAARGFGYKTVFVWGHGILAPIVLHARVENLSGFILTGTALGPFDFEWEDEFEREEWDESLESGVVEAPSYDEAVRSHQAISTELLRDVSTFKAESLLNTTSAPILLINGNDSQSWEPRRLAINKACASLLPNGSEMVTINRSDHSFKGHFEELGVLARNFITKHA